MANTIPTTPVDIQKRLDDWLAANTEAQKYVTKLWYIPEKEQPPPEVTHKLRLSSAVSGERAITIGIVAKPEYAAALDALLAMIATQPPA